MTDSDDASETASFFPEVVEGPQDELDNFALSSEGARFFRTTYVLECFGRERRGANVNRRIEQWLHERNLEMFPAIADADFYGEVEIRRISKSSENADVAESEYVTSGSPVQAASGVNSWVLSSLKDDAEELDFLEYGASVEDAINKMKDRGRSKLPVFFSGDDRSSLIGTVKLAELTFEKIEENSKLIEKTTTQVPVVGTNEKLFDWIHEILKNGFIYGKNDIGEVVQIYTTFDVARYMNTISEMFLRANEIEELLRSFLSRVRESDLRDAQKRFKNLTEIPIDDVGGKFFRRNEISPDGGQDSELRYVDSLMFGDYMKCIGDPKIWDEHFSETGIRGIDKERCLRSLNDARLARNTVMHFNRSDSFEKLIPSFESLAVWLRRVSDR